MSQTCWKSLERGGGVKTLWKLAVCQNVFNVVDVITDFPKIKGEMTNNPKLKTQCYVVIINLIRRIFYICMFILHSYAVTTIFKLLQGFQSHLLFLILHLFVYTLNDHDNAKFQIKKLVLYLHCVNTKACSIAQCKNIIRSLLVGCWMVTSLQMQICESLSFTFARTIKLVIISLTARLKKNVT